LSIFSNGNKYVYPSRDYFISFLFEFNEKQEIDKPSLHTIDAVRAVLVNTLLEHPEKTIEYQCASKLSGE
jgi:hypothetical protein